MAKPENQFIAGVHKYLNPLVYRMKTNNPYVAGIPDCYYSGSAADLWVEYKFVPKVPVRADIAVTCSPLQIAWLEGRAKEGRTVAVIIGCPDGGVILEIAAGVPHTITNADFRAKLQTRAAIAAWVAGKTHRD